MPLKHFTNDDVKDNRIFASLCDLEYDPPLWMRLGMHETRSGYGNRLTSGYKISFNGRMYRLYVTIYSNVGTTWFITKGRKIIAG